MPIAYNLNLILLDRSGNGALVETLDGRMAVRPLDETSPLPYTHATNHAVIQELASLEPEAMIHSLKRYDYIKSIADSVETLTVSQLKSMLLAPISEWTVLPFLSGFFWASSKSMILDPMDGIIELCWGGRAETAGIRTG